MPPGWVNIIRSLHDSLATDRMDMKPLADVLKPQPLLAGFAEMTLTAYILYSLASAASRGLQLPVWFPSGPAELTSLYSHPVTELFEKVLRNQEFDGSNEQQVRSISEMLELAFGSPTIEHATAALEPYLPKPALPPPTPVHLRADTADSTVAAPSAPEVPTLNALFQFIAGPHNWNTTLSSRVKALARQLTPDAAPLDDVFFATIASELESVLLRFFQRTMSAKRQWNKIMPVYHGDKLTMQLIANASDLVVPFIGRVVQHPGEKNVGPVCTIAGISFYIAYNGRGVQGDPVFSAAHTIRSTVVRDENQGTMDGGSKRLTVYLTPDGRLHDTVPGLRAARPVAAQKKTKSVAAPIGTKYPKAGKAIVAHESACDDLPEELVQVEPNADGATGAGPAVCDPPIEHTAAAKPGDTTAPRLGRGTGKAKAKPKPKATKPKAKPKTVKGAKSAGEGKDVTQTQQNIQKLLHAAQDAPVPRRELTRRGSDASAASESSKTRRIKGKQSPASVSARKVRVKEEPQPESDTGSSGAGHDFSEDENDGCQEWVVVELSIPCMMMSPSTRCRQGSLSLDVPMKLCISKAERDEMLEYEQQSKDKVKLELITNEDKLEKLSGLVGQAAKSTVKVKSKKGDSRIDHLLR